MGTVANVDTTDVVVQHSRLHKTKNLQRILIVAGQNLSVHRGLQPSARTPLDVAPIVSRQGTIAGVVQL